jgi:tRNA G18 (ribose-2'-O)-methylase SpoU
LVGKLAAKAAMDSGHRSIHRLYLAESLSEKSASPFIERARALDAPVERVDSATLSKWTGAENHGGVALEAGPRSLSSQDEWLGFLERLDHPAMVFAFERFHDAHNLGYALRCVEALGADAVSLAVRDWGRDELILSQSSSGSYDRLMIAPLQGPRDLFKRTEALGIESVATTAGAYRNLYDFDLRAPVLIAVGGEFQGLSEAVRRACRHSARLPMADAIPSFPAGHAAAIMASEAARQRRLGGRAGPLWPKQTAADRRPSPERAVTARRDGRSRR